jgi:hypothetical protein
MPDFIKDVGKTISMPAIFFFGVRQLAAAFECLSKFFCSRPDMEIASKLAHLQRLRHPTIPWPGPGFFVRAVFL